MSAFLYRFAIYFAVMVGAMLPFIGCWIYFLGVAFQAFPTPPFFLQIVKWSPEFTGAVLTIVLFYMMWLGGVVGYRLTIRDLSAGPAK